MPRYRKNAPALLIVQKYGGTSVGNVERIKNVARRCLATQSQGHKVVVVVCAMSGETNRLLELASRSRAPDERELDVIASTGEQVSRRARRAGDPGAGRKAGASSATRSGS